MKEPRRVALSILLETFESELDSLSQLPTLQAFTDIERKLLQEMMERRLHTPLTSSAGRLFDAVASIVGLRQTCRFEGQAAMELEFLTQNLETDESYSFELTTEQECLVIDWAPMVRGIVRDINEDVLRGWIAAKFHNTLAEMMVKVATASAQNKIVFKRRMLPEPLPDRARHKAAA